MKSKYFNIICYYYMYGMSEEKLWRTYGYRIGRRRFNMLMKDCLINYRHFCI